MNIFVHPVYAADENDNADPFARFGTHTEDSELTVNHTVWNNVLKATVVVLKPATKRKTKTKRASTTGSKLSRGSRAPAPLESNRVLFHLLNKEHLDLVSKYRQELEMLPTNFPLAQFDKDEQLAYWLNLHNAVLFEQLAKRYPISKLKKLRYGGKNKSSLWDEKLVTVNGVSLSLTDIQNKILIRHWNSPMVLYGLYQGAVGGPSLSNRAFTGKNVHDLLSQAAQEFVNSDRAVRVRSGKVSVSLVYDWGKGAFPDWQNQLANHLAAIAQSSLKTKMASANTFTAKLYDWDIADTKPGKISIGSRVLPSATNILNQARSQCENQPCPAGIPGSGGN